MYNVIDTMHGVKGFKKKLDSFKRLIFILKTVNVFPNPIVHIETPFF